MLLRRAIFGFVVAPLSFGLLMFVMSRSTGEGFLLLGATAMIGYPLALLMGVPLFVLFRHLRWNGLTPYLAAGIGFALLLSAVFVVMPNHHDAGPFESLGAEVESLMSTPRLAQLGLIFIVCLFSTASFWLIVRPDRDYE